MTLFIDPLDQILMDFNREVTAENPEGKTKLINYSEWSAKIRELLAHEQKDI